MRSRNVLIALAVAAAGAQLSAHDFWVTLAFHTAPSNAGTR
jgi:hypothetical protein